MHPTGNYELSVDWLTLILVPYHQIQALVQEQEGEFQPSGCCQFYPHKAYY